MISSSARLVLKSTAKLSALDSDLTFKSGSYAIATINFDLAVFLWLAGFDNSVFLDTRCKVTLVERFWLAKKFLSQKISVILVPSGNYI